MQYVIWNTELNTATSTVQRLPDNLEGLPIEELNALGYRELVTHRPEDYIPRFAMLSGPSFFSMGEDGRVHQEFPQADFSLVAVRNHLKEMAAKDASRVLFETDWYVIRKFETGTEIPEHVQQVRKMIRDHVEWIANDVENTDARTLVEYKWSFPMDAERVLVKGVWVKTDEPVGKVTVSEEAAPPLIAPPNPVQVPKEFNSWVNPLQVNIPPDQLENPADAADVAPIIEPTNTIVMDPNYNPEPPQPPPGIPVIEKDGTDIRAYTPQEIDEMDPELKHELMVKYITDHRPAEELTAYLKARQGVKNA